MALDVGLSLVPQLGGCHTWNQAGAGQGVELVEGRIGIATQTLQLPLGEVLGGLAGHGVEVDGMAQFVACDSRRIHVVRGNV